MKTYQFQTQGTCAASILITVEGDIVRRIQFQGGCAGNTKGVAALAKDRPMSDIIALLKGIRCGFKPTSCPDQLSTALELIATGTENRRLRLLEDAESLHP